VGEHAERPGPISVGRAGRHPRHGCGTTLDPIEGRITMTAITLPQAVETFVSAVNAHDADALLAAFGPGATVDDAGTTFAGEAELRDFVQVHLVAPRIELTPISYDAGRMVASGDGDFPGGPLTFAFAFETAGDRITHLAIEPV
jgi:hypothetical protein